MRHLMQFANARGWTPQRADIFGKKYLFSGYQPCFICIHMTRGDNSKRKRSFLKGCMHSDAVSLPLRGAASPPRSAPSGMGLPIRSREEELPLRLSPRAGLSHGPVSAPGPPGCAAGRNSGSQPVTISECPTTSLKQIRSARLPRERVS